MLTHCVLMHQIWVKPQLTKRIGGGEGYFRLVSLEEAKASQDNDDPQHALHSLSFQSSSMAASS